MIPLMKSIKDELQLIVDSYILHIQKVEEDW